MPTTVPSGLPIERETIPADAGHMRLGDAQDRRSGDRRVDRIAAVLQHIEGGEGGERRGRRGHAVGAVGGGAAGKLEISHGSV